MKRIKYNVINILNPNTGKYEGIPAIVGMSAYEIACQHGFTGSESDFCNRIEQERSIAIDDIRELGNYILEQIPDDIPNILNDIEDIKKLIESGIGGPSDFGCNSKIEVPIINNETISITNGETTENPFSSWTPTKEDICGKIFKVIWDGTEYFLYGCQRSCDSETISQYIFGNGNLANSYDDVNTEVPFVFVLKKWREYSSDLPSLKVFTKDTESTTHTVSIIRVDIDCTKIPQYYLDTDNGNKLIQSGSGVGSIVLNGSKDASGDYSLANGYSKASGNFSHAEGYDTNAIGIGSHAEGYNTTVEGEYSHAEGFQTVVKGNHAHAEGYQTKSEYNYAHAEGIYTTASGPASHAEGSNTNASTDFSHAEGHGTTASGTYSHAEGHGTTAEGTSSHAEGYNTTASGYESHAEGYNTTASGNYSHSEGEDTIASAIGSHAEGHSTTTNGEYSHAEGESTTASGNSSHAEGKNTTASGPASHSEGESTTASGVSSHAEGNNTTASANYSHAEGGGTTVKSEYSHAEGYETSIGENANYSHTEGYKTKVLDEAHYSHAEGWSTTAKGGASHAEGYYTSAYGDDSHSEGQGTIATGNNSHAEGYQTTAEGNSSHAEGHGTTASGDTSHSEGQSTTASGSFSHAEGNYTTASSSGSHAEGYSTTASGPYSHAEGNKTTASGNYSHAEGNETTALDYQFAIGHYNDTTNATAYGATGVTGTAFVIGNGTSSAKSNAFRVTGNGETYAKGAYNTTGADYAEFAEWADGNPDDEDRRGYFVTFDEEKPNMIRKANEGDYILGVISGNPCIIGNSDESWIGKYCFDEFGSYIYEEVEYDEPYIEKEIKVNEETGKEEEVIVEKTRKVKCTTYKINPDFDPEREYIHRSLRKEWDYVGWIGVLSVRDDGTCKPGGYCKPTEGGIATTSERTPDSYRVLERLTDNVIKVAIK